MWLLPSKGRPDAVRTVLDECWQTGMRQPAILYVQGDPQGYDFKRPDNWQIIYGNENLRGSMQLTLTTYPNERAYGWIADDTHPQTEYWSYYLEDLAAPWRLAHAQDMYVSDMKARESYALLIGSNLGGGICWGGELVRFVGHWSPEFVVQAGIDWYWTSLLNRTPLIIYQHNILIKHDNYRTNRRPKDATDDLGLWVQEDTEKMREHIKGKQFADLRASVLERYKNYVADGE